MDRGAIIRALRTVHDALALRARGVEPSDTSLQWSTNLGRWVVVASGSPLPEDEAVNEVHVGKRVYSVGGTVAHRLSGYGGPEYTCAVALCGVSTYPFLWRGTSNDEERQTVAQLPLCANCARVIAAEDRRIAAAKAERTKVLYEAFGLNQESQTRGTA
jgi:hypothetical protein